MVPHAYQLGSVAPCGFMGSSPSGGDGRLFDDGPLRFRCLICFAGACEWKRSSLDPWDDDLLVVTRHQFQYGYVSGNVSPVSPLNQSMRVIQAGFRRCLAAEIPGNVGE